ncbi:putative 30S ribosomal protein S10 [Cardiosporidium cionae]|uniref:30S ribosomal protein S10 n=1 Tax=Cardiosporidium cionae TaxID=476202 RepID=A0ABQ7JGC4_9APIC|nr:putative 30S ribosomal protein S10 [Cardiosporidium cionae]|eukprot:KAF8823072.1 putative 30S ribosomal protein S10 [Cardiosporidium cionae]
MLLLLWIRIHPVHFFVHLTLMHFLFILFFLSLSTATRYNQFLLSVGAYTPTFAQFCGYSYTLSRHRTFPPNFFSREKGISRTTLTSIPFIGRIEDEKKAKKLNPWKASQMKSRESIREIAEDEDKELFWPNGCYLRIKLAAYRKEDMHEAVSSILEGLKHNTALRVKGAASLPTKRKRFSFMRSPFVDKDSREAFQISIHTKIIDIYYDSKSNGTASGKISRFLPIKLPSVVNSEIQFESINRQVKTKDILADYSPRWISKYVEYHTEMEKKIPVIQELLSDTYKGHLHLDWPKSFHELRRFPLVIIEKMLKKVKQNRNEGLARVARGKPEFVQVAKWFD